VVAGTQVVNFASAQSFENIIIKADGSIDPSTAPITQTGNVYTMTGKILGSITVEKFNIVIDGAGYSIQGNGTGRGIQIFNPYNATIKNSYDVTVKNVSIKFFEEGIDVFGYWGNIIMGVVIAGNNVTNNDVGIRFSSYYTYSNNIIIGNDITANNVGVEIAMAQEGGKTSGNKITGNQIANNNIGMRFYWMSSYAYDGTNPLNMNNTIFYNNFVSNSQNVVNTAGWFAPACANIWDNGATGNYWSDYNGIDANHDGIGDTNYTIDSNNIDHYPLMAPVDISKITIDSLTPTPTPIPTPTPTLTPTQSPSPSLSPQETEPQPESKPFPTTLVVASLASVAIIGAGALVFFKKRSHARINKHSEIEQSSTLYSKRARLFLNSFGRVARVAGLACQAYLDHILDRRGRLCAHKQPS
jgi:hypothetical protein